MQRSDPSSAEPAGAAGTHSLAALAVARDGLWAVLNVVQAVSTVLWTAGWITAALVVRAVTRDVRVPLAMARRCWAPGMLRVGGIRVEIEGVESVDFSRPHFFAANHQSLVDALVLFYAVPVPLIFILKEELRRVPFLGAYAEAMGMVFIRRGERRRSLENLELCRRRLDGGVSIAMFPEGTRSRDGRVAPFKTATFLPPIDTGVPIVPVALEGPGRLLPPGTFKVRPGTIRVSFGRPVATAGLDRKDRRRLAGEVRQRIVERQAALKTR